MRLIRFAAVAAWVAVMQMAVATPSIAASCPERPACRGCGCKGGPGYRGPDGRCVGFRQLAKVCGTPPDQRCIFENAPGTGANRGCALEERPRKPAG